METFGFIKILCAACFICLGRHEMHQVVDNFVYIGTIVLVLIPVIILVVQLSPNQKERESIWDY